MNTIETETKIKKERRAKFLYFLDEFSIFIFVFMGVIFSEAILKRAKGQLATASDLWIDPLNIAISGFIAISAYASVHTRFIYSEKGKPSYIKRVSTAIGMGITWKMLMGLDD